MLALGAPASHAEVTYIGFCADDTSMGMFIGTVKAPSIGVQTLAYSEAQRIAISFADRFARQGCGEFLAKQMQQHLQPARHLSAARPRRPRGATFSLARQAQQFLPAIVCSGSTGAAAFAHGLGIMNADSGTPSGPNVCPTLVIRSFTRFISLPRKPPALRGRSRGVAAPAADVGGAAGACKYLVEQGCGLPVLAHSDHLALNILGRY